MGKTIKELIRDRYEKLLDRIKRIENSTSSMAFDLAELLTTSEEHKELLERILEILEAGLQPDANFFWPADKEKLDAELAIFADLSEAHNALAFDYQEPNMQAACNIFQDHLDDKFADVELVNFQQERHNYEQLDRAKHADAIVILVNPADPSEDIIVDFCRASKEPGTLYGKLQFLIVGETPW